MYVHNIDPVLVNFLGFEIRYYGLVYALGFLFVLWIVPKLASIEKIRSLNDESIQGLLFWIMVSGVIFGRLFHVFAFEPSFYLNNPSEIPAIWHGGMSIHGGIFGAVFAALIFCKKRKINFYKAADLIVLPLPIVLAFGRIANFINGELVGTVTNLPWCVKFPYYEGCRHPVVLYESLKNLVIAGFLAFLFDKRRILKYNHGTLFWSFLGSYSLLRFFVQFLRTEDKILFNLDIAQYFSIFLFIVSVIMILRINSKK